MVLVIKNLAASPTESSSSSPLFLQDEEIIIEEKIEEKNEENEEKNKNQKEKEKNEVTIEEEVIFENKFYKFFGEKISVGSANFFPICKIEKKNILLRCGDKIEINKEIFFVCCFKLTSSGVCSILLTNNFKEIKAANCNKIQFKLLDEKSSDQENEKISKIIEEFLEKAKKKC